MKKFWKTLMFALVGVFALSSCEDVPAPYPIPNANGEGTTGTLATVSFVNGMGGWTTQDNTALNGVWTNSSQYGMVASGYKNGKNNISESWFISPEIDLTEATDVVLIVNEAVNKIGSGNVEELMTVWATTDDGATWEPLKANARPSGTSWTFQEDKFDLSAYSGKKIKIGFKYVSNEESAGTWEIKDIKLQGIGSANIEGSDTPTPTGIEVTCAEAVELTNALDDGATSTETYVITGYITETVGSPSRNQQTFWMADTKNGGKVFEAYYANLPEGVSEFKVGMKVKITGNLMKYVKDGKVTPEIKNADVEILENGSDTPDTPTGTEITCAQAVELTNALGDGATSTEVYTITGYITEVVSSVSRNQQSFWIADTKDGGKVFQAYWANLPEGVSEFKAGMKVKITGNLMKYVKDGKVTPEIKNATVEILENGSDTPDTPTGSDITCAQAVTLTNALEDGGTSTETYTITGYITEVVSSVSRNQQSFWMADTKDGGKVFQAYWANLPEGVSEFKAGMKVKITGNLLKYVKDGNVTPEIKNATVEILESGDNGDTPDPDPVPDGDVVITATAMGLANNTAWTTITVNGVTFTADGGGNTNSPKYFDNGKNLRMYPKNTLTIKANKKIATIALTCTAGSVANGNVGANPGSVNVSDPAILISGINSDTVTITNNDGSTGAASQIRIESFSISFAE